jgi:hypothetical protein
MTTILLVWYALGWVVIGYIAINEGKLSLAQATLCMVMAPLVPVFLPVCLVVSILEQSGSIIIWRRK